MKLEKHKRSGQAVRLPLLAGAGALAFLLAGVPPAHASTADYFDLDPEQLLSAKVISVSKKDADVANSPAAVYVISQEDIARSGMNSIPDLLRMVPGVEVAQQASDSWAISIRGFNNTLANKILVMIDGRTVYNPLFAGTFWEIQDLPLEDIERIEVIRGPGGALWGANAVNGIINIITKNAKDTQGGLLSAGAGNVENGFGTLRYGGALGSAWGGGYYRAYIKGFDRGSFHNSAGGRGNDDWQSGHGGFRMDWGDQASGDYSSLHGDVYHVDSDEFYNTYSLTAPYSSVNAETVESRGGNILGLWNHTYGDGGALKLQSYIDYTERSQYLLHDRRTMFDTEAQYNFANTGRHAITVGANYRLTADDIGGSDLVSFDPASETQNLFGLFGQDKIALAPDNWFLTLGTKIEHNDYTGFEFQPSASLQWFPADNQTVWASVSRAVRTPSRIERDLNITNIVVPPGTFGIFPTEVILSENKNFDSEKLIAYELGYRNRITSAVSVDTTAFVNDYTSLSSGLLNTPFVVNNGVDPIHTVLPLVAVNGMTGEVYGFEMAGTWNVNDRWKLSATYSYLDIFVHAPVVANDPQDGAEKRSPRNQASIRSFWNINDRWTLDTMAYYVDRLPAYDIDSYVRLDMNLGWQITDGVQFNLVGQNLLQSDHREFGGDNAINANNPGRSVFGKVTWRF
jgi:iron complex outermembrane receptor protein